MMTDKHKIINALEKWVENHKGEALPLAYSAVVETLDALKEQRTTVEVVSVTKENGSVNLFAFRESSDAIKCFCYWKEKGATVTCGEVDIQ